MYQEGGRASVCLETVFLKFYLLQKENHIKVDACLYLMFPVAKMQLRFHLAPHAMHPK